MSLSTEHFSHGVFINWESQIISGQMSLVTNDMSQNKKESWYFIVSESLLRNGRSLIARNEQYSRRYGEMSLIGRYYCIYPSY